MDGKIEELLGQPIQLTELVRKAVEEADSFKQECLELNKQVDKLAKLLRAAARLSSHGGGSLYERPTRRIMMEVTKTLEKALALVKKCKKSGVLKRVITITSATDFRRVNVFMESAIGDVKWLLNVSACGEERTSGMEGLPPIASTDPMLAWVWGQIAHVQGGNPEDKEDGASYLASLAADSERNGKIIIEEGGVPPLLKLLREGTLAGQLAAATALGNLAIDQARVQQIVAQGAITAFVHILADAAAPMKVQAKVAWALAKMVSLDSEAQRDFAGGNVVRPLVSLLIFETMDVTPKLPKATMSIHTLVKTSMAVNRSGAETKPVGLWNPGEQEWQEKLAAPDTRSGWLEMKSEGEMERKGGQKGQLGVEKLFRAGTTEVRAHQKSHHGRSISDSYYSGLSARELIRRERENEDPETKRDLKAQVTKALWKLAENNVKNSRRITDTKALTCFAKLIEKEHGEVLWNSVMAVMEIATAAERDVDLRRFAFKTNSPAVKALVDQLLRVIEQGEPELKVPCLKAIGCLARIFPARETKVLGYLVTQLCHNDSIVAAEAATALEKFVKTDNFLHNEHSRTIVEASALPHLVQLVTLDEKEVQVPAVILLSYLSLHVGNNDVFWETAAHKALETASHSSICQKQSVRDLLLRAIQHLELYQAGGHSHKSMYH